MVDCAEGYPRVRWDRCVGKITEPREGSLWHDEGSTEIVVGNVLA